MFVKAIHLLVTSVLVLSASSSAPGPEAYASRSCAELAAKRNETDAAATRLAAWMERHCPGAREDTDSFCRRQSGFLLDRLAELGKVKAAIAAQRCDLREVPDAGAEGHASLRHLAVTPPLPVDHPRTIGSFEDNWPWPRRPTFQAGLAATAGFRIRNCRVNPDCEW